MDIAIVLGNRMNDDGTLSYRMQTRLGLTLKLIAEHAPDKIIVSGGLANKTAGITEAAAMKRWLTANGVPEEKIIVEDKSLTTKQNAKYALPLALDLKPDVIWLCTSKEHIARKYLNPVKLFDKQLKRLHGKATVEAYTNK